MMLQLRFLSLLTLVSLFADTKALTSSRHRYQALTHVVEIYWESYLAFPNDLESCRTSIQKRSVDSTVRFGANLTQLELGTGDVVNIAFANADLN